MAFEALIVQLRSGEDQQSNTAAAELARTAEGVDALIGVIRDKNSGPGRTAAVGGLLAAAGNFPGRRRQFANILARTFREGSDASWAAARTLSEVDPPRAMKEALTVAARLENAKPGKSVTLQRCVAYQLGLLASRDPEWRGQSIRPLTMLLRQGSASDEAAEALGRLDDERAFSALLDAVREHGPRQYEPRLIESLARSPRAAGHADEVTAAFARILELNPGGLDAREAATGLARFPGGLAHLRALLRHPPVSYNVLDAVGNARDQEAVAPLIDLLADEQASGERSILQALGKIGGERAVEAVLAQLHSPGRTWDAAAALAGMGRPGVAASVRRWEDPDPGIREAVRAGLTAERDKVVSPLIEEITTGADLDRALAARVLARLDEAQATPYLEDLLRHDSPVARLAACDAFAALTSPPPARALEPLLADGVPEIRASAATAMARTTEPPARRLAALLADPDVRVQAAAVHGLAATGSSAVPEIRGLLGHDTAVVRNAAALALAGLGDEGQAAISDAAASEMPDIRGAAAVAAGAMANPAGLEMLGTLIRDPAAGVRVRALDAVPVTGAAVAGDVAAILRTGGEWERDAAARTLLRVATHEPGGWAGRTLLEAIEDLSPTVVGSVAAAIGTALERAEPVRQPLPAWFGVRGDGYRLLMSEQATAIISALERAATQNALAAAALATVRRTLEAKLHGGWNELGIMYGFAPSRQPDLDLIERLSRIVPPDPDQAEPRYLDATLFHDGQRQPDTEALREGQTYDLEVAVRVAPVGISVPGKREPIAEPRQAEEVEVLVVAEGQAGLRVDEPVARLLLPPSGDSTVNPRFRVTAETASAGPAGLGKLRLRLFYRYSLLESAVIQAEIVSRFRPEVRSQFDLDTPITLSHDRIERGYADLEDEIERALHIDVSRDGPGFCLRFTWKGGSGEPLSLPAPTFITPAELSDIIDDTRRKLLRVTMSDAYATKLDPGKDDCLDAMRTLAAAGRALYVRLFRLKLDSAIMTVSEKLRELPPPPGSVIQVSLACDAADFLFPWALLYDAALPDESWESPDPDGFWGLRYCIEQRPPKWKQQAPASVRIHPDPQRMAFMLWDQFANAAEHSAMIGGLFGKRPGDLEVSTPPINRASAASKEMTAADAKDIYYFYAHAHVRNPNRSAGILDAFVDTYQKLPPGGKAREAFGEAYKLAIEEADEDSWIKLTYGRLTLTDLYAGPVRFRSSPLVFINACESSQLTPSLSGQSFVSFFLDRGAAAFLGTECTMTAVFAHPFGEFVLRRLLSGDTIAAALLAARKHFAENRNPLGLAYSQYGYAGFRLTTGNQGGTR